MASALEFGSIKTLRGSYDLITLDMVTTTSGAVPSTFNESIGISTVVRNSAGKYTITLSERWYAFRGLLSSTVLIASLTSTKGIDAHVISEAVNSSTPTIVVQFLRSDTLAAADVDDGARVILNFLLAKSDV